MRLSRNGRDIRTIMEKGTAIDQALQKAAHEALLIHKRLGLPLAIWRDGRTEWVTPEEFEQAPGAAAKR